MSDPNNSGNNPQQQQIVWNAGQYAPQGQWITVNVPNWVVQTTAPVANVLDFTEDFVIETKKFSDGCTCKKCREFFPYAEPNQKDGTLVCYGCRMTW